MEFEAAAKRLARDQSKIKNRRVGQGGIISAKAQREAAFRKKQQEKIRLEREKAKKQQQYVRQYMSACDRTLGISSLGGTRTNTLENDGSATSNSTSSSNNLLLEPTSIHGDGDKIALPPSVLHYLTSSSDNITASGSPWTFRVGLVRPNYVFPASSLIKMMKPPDESDDEMATGDNDESEDEDNDVTKVAYLDELSQKYISYTHCTVVEFTQEEGNVGLPASIASALLDPKRRLDGDVVPVTRTVDPASIPDKDREASESGMDVDAGEEKTPGHLAWGEFDIPNTPVEITFLQLPKGKGCTLVPTKDAIQNGFYDLKDVKLVLEQSLIRTRATLSIGDVVHTWHRGFKFDMIVSKVLPSTFSAVSCINTDIEVDIGSTDLDDTNDTNNKLTTTASTENVKSQSTMEGGGGRTLSSAAATAGEASTKEKNHMDHGVDSSIVIPSEPAEDDDCAVRIQFRLPNGRRVVRRFLGCEKIQVLYDYVKNECNSEGDEINKPIELRYGFPPKDLVSKMNDTIKDCSLDGEQIQGRFI